MSESDEKTQAQATDSANGQSWIQTVRDQLAGANQKVDARLRTTLQCKMVGSEPSLLVPPELAEDQPEMLEYLHEFTETNSLSLIEDRRRLDLAPIIEQRRNDTPNMAMGISLLLKQTGMPGSTCSLSSPHMLKQGNRRIDVAELIRLGAAIQPKSRKIVFLPNAFVRTRLLGEAQTMTGYACKVKSRQGDDGENRQAGPDGETGDTDPEKIEPTTTVVQFEAQDFHALGYVTNNQFAVTVFLAGGPIINPSLWTYFYNLSETPFNCQIFDSPYAGQMFGLFYKTYYIELENQFTELTRSVTDAA